ncbi:MAG: hypothetical protein ACYCZR_01635 [Burkholderiales bacterium]
MDKQNGNGSCYLLIKREGFSANGRIMTARESALALLEAGIWPLWVHTRNRLKVKEGDEVAVYLSGESNQVVMARATVGKIAKWNRLVESKYPLMLDDAPYSVLNLEKVEVFKETIRVGEILDRLSFVSRKNPKKWGVSFMGGMRSVPKDDFELLTRR